MRGAAVNRLPLLRQFARDFIAFFRRMDWLTDCGRVFVTDADYQRFVREEFPDA